MALPAPRSMLMHPNICDIRIARTPVKTPEPGGAKRAWPAQVKPRGPSRAGGAPLAGAASGPGADR